MWANMDITFCTALQSKLEQGMFIPRQKLGKMAGNQLDHQNKWCSEQVGCEEINHLVDTELGKASGAR